MTNAKRLSRKERAVIARHTLSVVAHGSYTCGESQINFSSAQTAAKESTKLWLPEELTELVERVEDSNRQFNTIFEVQNETVLSVSHQLHLLNDGRVCALNFASAKNPGGGFLGGSQAQEESIARSSGLYNCVADVLGYYDFHRQHRDTSYSDRAIFSEDVPVFRDDDGNLLQNWFPLSIVTCAAVNAGAYRRKEPELIEPKMKMRVNKVLGLAVHQKVDNLVLGAWGCGVFKNDPVKIAKYFADALNGPFKGRFKRVVFAVLDYTKGEKVINPFREQFTPDQAC